MLFFISVSMYILVYLFSTVQCIFLLISNLCHTCNIPIVLYPSDHEWSFIKRGKTADINSNVLSAGLNNVIDVNCCHWGLHLE